MIGIIRTVWLLFALGTAAPLTYLPRMLTYNVTGWLPELAIELIVIGLLVYRKLHHGRLPSFRKMGKRGRNKWE